MNPEQNQQPEPQQNPITEPAAQVIPATSQPIQQQPAVQPISSNTQGSQQSRKKPLVIGGVVLLVVILIAAGAFAFMADTPDDDKDSAIDTSSTEQTTNIEDPNSKPLEGSDNTQTQNIDSDDQYYSRTYIIARDTERKTELKNAQYQLEEYYVNYGEYPSDWTLVVTNSDDRFGPRNDAYIYVVSTDLQSYKLSADLENDDDLKADANGNYVIISVNQ